MNDAIQRIKEQDILLYIEQVTGKKAEHLTGSQYRMNPCPICQHKDHFTIYADTKSYNSFANCVPGGSIIDFHMHYFKKDKAAAIQDLTAYFNIDEFPDTRKKEQTREKPQLKKEAKTMTEVDKSDKTPPQDYSLLIEEWSGKAGETDYFKRRGLSDRIIEKYKLGYSPNGGEYGSAFKYSMPVSNTYVIFREEGSENGRYRNSKGAADILNSHYISDDKQYVFICEGYFDALSLEELGFNAIALNSTSNKGRFLELLEDGREAAKGKTFILCPDNDKAGKALENEMIEGFKTLGLSLEVMSIDKNIKDINEWLVNDSKTLRYTLNKKVKGDYVGYYLETFFEQIKANKNKPIISTGFRNLNQKMGGGIFPGLYVIGGISSLGKTAFTLQMSDYIASQGHDVLFFSLEMSKLELVSRSISRHLFKIDRKKCLDCGTLTISRGNFQHILPEMNDALRDYSETAENLIIKEGNFDTNIDTIRIETENHINRTGKTPVIFVDYLQILKGKGTGNDKQEMDFVATELKRISRDYDTPVIVVSSFSRSNYYTPVGMESFKESGAIEYTADVLIGLQLTILKNLNLSNDTARAQAKIQINTAKAENPRKVSAVILKQRNASPYVEQEFTFYPVNNLFMED